MHEPVDQWDDGHLPEWFEQDLEGLEGWNPEEEETWEVPEEEESEGFNVEPVVGDTSWMSEGTCAVPENSHLRDLFFADSKDQLTWSGRVEDPVPDPKNSAATAICGTCPVREKCLKFSLENKIMFGVWGGKTQHIRNRYIPVGEVTGSGIDQPIRDSYPCPNCRAVTKNMRTTPDRTVYCRQCGFSWKSEYAAGVIDYHYVRTASEDVRKRKEREQERQEIRDKKQEQREAEIEKALETRRKIILEYVEEVVEAASDK